MSQVRDLANLNELGRHLTRQSYYKVMIHQQDDLKNTGYDWRSNLMENNLSGYIMSDEDRADNVNQFGKLMVDIIDKVSYIKKEFNYTVDKDYKYLL
jgi:hypothetical protein